MNSSSSTGLAEKAGVNEVNEKPHVLVVDDGSIERSVAKMLFTLAECKGNIVFKNADIFEFIKFL